MSADELKEIRKIVQPHLEKARSNHGLNMIFFMLTNIITESSELLCCGPEAREKILSAYDLPEDTETIMLRGVVSRKKQLVRRWWERCSNKGRGGSAHCRRMRALYKRRISKKVWQNRHGNREI